MNKLDIEKRNSTQSITVIEKIVSTENKLDIKQQYKYTNSRQQESLSPHPTDIEESTTWIWQPRKENHPSRVGWWLVGFGEGRRSWTLCCRKALALPQLLKGL